MALESLLLRLDRIARGRQAGVSISASDRTHPRTRRAFTWIFWLLLVELVLGLGAVVIALLLAMNGEPVSLAVWMRTVIVLVMTATLFYFAWRAAKGWRWAYLRLRLFSQIFPVITLVIAAIPNLYPVWMVTEQIIFSLIMIGIADFLTSDHMRAAFRDPAAAASSEGAAT
ncbi:hypothetical protein SRABI76_00106 [Microbacterium oxydans]|uniref:hypothetical protein n=1 Tax=Microbacterium oxydans TaxID=82380 RepID=UPI001D297124|nr:hypothetical protein [Microbacterium oxydans]CAH0124756.1 hypothetical protein SRABI76_00106 [Microbacterium oxydans]